MKNEPIKNTITYEFSLLDDLSNWKSGQTTIDIIEEDSIRHYEIGKHYIALYYQCGNINSTILYHIKNDKYEQVSSIPTKDTLEIQDLYNRIYDFYVTHVQLYKLGDKVFSSHYNLYNSKITKIIIAFDNINYQLDDNDEYYEQKYLFKHDA